MANSYFKFKQFTIHQDKCAMKVCTDACLFGALLPPNPLKGECHVLDIGTGTGLLSLMIAQKSNEVKIDAVEIDTQAAAQATGNIAASPWADRIHVFNEDILTYRSGEKYDCIISNPPFFEDDLQSADEAKNNAKHDTALNLLQLLQVVNGKLAKDGFFAVLLPYHRVRYFIAEAEKTGLHVSKQIFVKQTLKHKFFRGILFFSRKQTEPQLSEIIIRDTQHNYTPEFAAALKDYYLFL
jgi:tRNA1Val (adenine37-N6)-methyltransferase